MRAISYLTDGVGQKKGIFIDLDELKRTGRTGHDVVIELLEDIEDLIYTELVRGEKTIPWEEVKAQLRGEGLLDK